MAEEKKTPYYDPSDPNQTDPKKTGIYAFFGKQTDNLVDENGKPLVNYVDEQVSGPNRQIEQQEAIANNNYEYGGAPGMADWWAKAYGGHSDQQWGLSNAYYAQANRDRDLALQARGNQGDVAGMMLARARGDVPSIAQQQASLQMGQLASGQASAAAGARGPAGIALAQQQAAANTATGQSAISGQAQINAAMERERAEQAAMGAYSSMRGQDQQSQQLGYGAAGQAGAQALGYSGLQAGVNQSQLQAQGNKEAQKSANKFGMAGLQAQEQARKDANSNALIGAGATALIAGGMFLSDERAKNAASVPGFAAATAPAPSNPDALAMSAAGGTRAQSGANPAGLAQGANTSTRMEGRQSPAAYQAAVLPQKAVGQDMESGQLSYVKNTATAPPRQNIPRAPQSRVEGTSFGVGQVLPQNAAGENDVYQSQLAGYQTSPLQMPQQQAGVSASGGVPSDERAKDPASIVPVTWGNGTPAPGNDPYEQANEAARKALYDQELKENDARLATSGGIAASGTGAIDRYEGDKLALTRAKERHGIAPTQKEEMERVSQEYSERREKTQGGPQKNDSIASDAKKNAPPAEKKFGDWSDKQAKGLQMFGGIGQGLMQRGANMPMPSNPYVAPQFQQITSDMGAKNAAPMMSDMGSKNAASMMSDMGTKAPAVMYSDEKTKDKVDKRAVTDAAIATKRAATKAPIERAQAESLTERLERAQNSIRDSAEKVFAPAESREMETSSLPPLVRARAAELGPPKATTTATPPADPEEATRAEYHRIYSDERAKDIVPLSEPEGHQLHIGEDGRARYERESAPQPTGASLSGPVPKYGKAPSADAPSTPLAKAFAKPAPQRKMSDEEMMKWADNQIASVHEEGARADARGPAVRGGDNPDEVFHENAPLANAARAQKGSPYSYKEEFRPPEQAPGEVNVGPMAQNMAKDPVASTAVREAPNGLLSLDRDKLLKVHGAVQAAQQEEIDALHQKIGLLTRAKKGPRAA